MFYGCNSLTSVTLPEGLTSINDSTFENCGFTSITIPDSVTYIGSHAFSYCDLTSITIPEGVTYIGSYAFSCCHHLFSVLSVTFEGAAPSIGDNAFYDTTATVRYPNLESSWTSSVMEQYGGTLTWESYTPTNRGSCGLYGSNLTWRLSKSGTLTISGSGKMADYTNTGAPWPGSATTLVLGKNVTGIGNRAFAFCYDLETIVLEDGNSSFRLIDGVLFNSDGTELLLYPQNKADTVYCVPNGVTTLAGYAFYSCNNLTELTLPKSLHTIEDYALGDLPPIRVYFSGDAPSIAEKAFSNSGYHISYYNVVTCYYYGSQTNWPTSKLKNYDGLLCWVDADNAATDELTVVASGYLDYSGQWKLTSDGVLTIENTGSIPDFSDSATGYWYPYMDQITHIRILSNYSVSIGKNAFRNFTALKTVEFPIKGVSPVSAYAFAGCDSLEKVIFPASSNSITIEEGAFYGCSSLKTVGYPVYTKIGSNAFAGCTSLEEIYFTNGVSSISVSGNYAENTFTGVTATVKYPAGISLYAPDATAFGGTLTWEPTPYGYCTNDIQWAYDSDTGTLTLSGKGELPEYVSGSFTPWTAKNSEISKAVVEEGITTLPSYTFEYASSLSSVSLPNTLCELAPNAFNNCSSLNNLLIPRSVIYFKTENFNRCPALTDLYYEGTWEDWRNVENGSYAITTGMTVHKLVLKSSAATCTQPGLEAHYRFDDYSKPGAYLDLYDLDKQKSNSLKNDPPIPHLFDTYVYNEDATCLADGTETALCDYDCGTADVRQAEGTMLAHLFTVYNENGDATCLADSTETALCDYGCGTVDTRTVPDTMLEHLFTQYVSDGNATCLADGTKTALCDYGCGVTQQLLDEGSMLAHTPVTDEAKTPTCTETGLTEGSHCATCPTVFVAQTVLPATGHDEVCDAAKAPTCTETGLTEGFHCGVCDIVLVEQTLLPAKGHAEVIDAAKAPTCTETGLTEGKHCDVCDTVLTAQTILPAAGHTDVIDAAKAPTCTETGLTEGVHCSVCNTVLTAQTQIPANGHTEVIDEAKAPTCTETGLTEGVHCSVCSTVLTAQTQIPANGHTEVTDGAKAPTCTETGLTEGVHCSVCNAVLTAQTEVPANGHTNATPVTEITTPATCTLPGVQDTVVFCTVCSLELSRVSAELPATGHTEDPALRVSGLGYDTCTCAICGETYVVWQDARLQYITLSGMTDLTLQDDSYPWIYNSDLNRFESGNYRVNSSSSGFTLTFTLPTNALVSFDYGVSSESGFDNLSVSDTCGGLTVSLVNPISGTQSGSYSGVLTPGEHRLTFSYSKDGSVNTGSDLGWFSDLRITVCTHPEYTVVTTPPTCTQVGGTVYTCTACGHAYPGEEIPAAGHLWSEPDADFFRICKTCSVSEQVTSISGTTTDGLNWELTATGTLTVSGSGNCTDGSAWAAYTNRITSFVAASGITGVFEEVLWDLSLTSVTLSETVTDLAVEALSANSEDLAQITVHADNPAYSASGNVLFNKAQTALLLYPAGKTDSVYSIPATVLCIDDYAFRNCQRLTALFLPAKLEQLGNRCFDGCTGLQNIVLDSSNGYFTCDRNTALIRKEDGALVLYCAGSLQSSYTVPNGVTYIASFAFADAANLKTLSLPLSLDEIESSAFVRCKSLASVTYPGTEAYWNHSVTVSTRSNTALTEAAFTFGTVDTLSGTCGDHLTWTLELTPGLLTISGKGDMAFTTVSGLLGHVSAPWPATAVRSVVIQEGITSLCDMAFEHCTALTDVSLPATLTELGRFAFEGCSSLTSITIPENITSIPRSAFENCTALTDVTIPESVTTIEYDAFFSCPIATMHYTGSEPRWGLVTLADGNTSLLIAEHVFNSYLLAEWNSSHTVLSLSEKVDDSAYVVAAFYAPDGQMVLAKHYTADEVQSGVGISSSAINLKTCTAKIMVLDENYAPLGVPYTPDIQKYVYRKAWLYATEHAYIDGGRLADAGTLLFSDGRTVTTVNTDVCDLGIWDLGQEYFLTIDPTTGEVVSVRLSGGSTSGTSSLYNLDWRRVKDDLNTWYSFTIGGVEGMFAGNLIPCLYLTPDGNGIPTTMASKDLYNIAGNAVADLYHVVDKDNDGEIDYLLVQPCLYAKITETGVHKTYGPYMELTDASGNELLFDGNSRWYIADNTDLKGSPEEGDFLKLSWNPEKGIYETDILDPKSAVFEKRTTAKGTYTFGDTRYTAADDRWITDEQLAELILGTYYTIVTDGELLLSVDAVTIVPLDAATMFTDGADIDEKAKNGVELLCTLKVMKAYADNSYKPNGIITRAEVAAILYRICTGDVKDEYADLWVGIFNCTDVDDGDWYAGYVGYCFSNCIIRGDSDGTFRPHDPITTTEAARWLLAAIGYDGDALGYYGPEWEQNVLRDAVNTRLLENYLHSTSGATTRQWLAVMLENMLTKAYTIDTVVPGDPSADVYILMGEKYFGLTKDSLIYRLVYSL